MPPFAAARCVATVCHRLRWHVNNFFGKTFQNTTKPQVNTHKKYLNDAARRWIVSVRAWIPGRNVSAQTIVSNPTTERAYPHASAHARAHARTYARTCAHASARPRERGGGRVKSPHHNWLPSVVPLIFLCARNWSSDLPSYMTLTGERQPIFRTDYGGAILIVRTCEYCGRKYAARRNTSRYCSDNCRKYAFFKRKKGVCVAAGGNAPECLERMEPISRVPASGHVSARAVEKNTVELRGMGAFFDVASTAAPIKYRPMCSELSRGIAGLLREVGL